MLDIRILTLGVVVFMGIATGLTYFMPRISPPAEVSADAVVVYVGPTETTRVEAEFISSLDGELATVKVRTTDELVRAVFSGLTQCNGRTDFDESDVCEKVDPALMGQVITSHHTSEAVLAVDSVVTVDGATLGLTQGPVELVSGSLTGVLTGRFEIGEEEPVLSGSASLTIQEGSTATYACFTGFGAAGPLLPCSAHLGGQLLPVRLSVVDTGEFQLERTIAGAGSMPIREMRGSVRAEVRVPGSMSTSDGILQVIDATTWVD